jgi:hypothetical protein
MVSKVRRRKKKIHEIVWVKKTRKKNLTFCSYVILPKENEPTKKKSESSLEIENAYLTQQNQHISKELSFARYTITALKNITHQKEANLEDTRQELEHALQHIQLLTYRLKQAQRLSLAGPTLIQDDLSDDQELSEEEYDKHDHQDIMSKLPLRHPIINVMQPQQPDPVVMMDYSC